jgi:hypothetical protein
MTLNLNDLNEETLEKFGLLDKPKRNQTFYAEDVKRNAFRVMGVMDKLSKAERERVLIHCQKLNEVK